MRGLESNTAGAYLETLFDEAPFGIALLNLHGRYVRVNERLAEINGRPAAAHTGRTIEDVAPDIAPVARRLFLEAVRTKRTQALTADGPVPGDTTPAHWALSCYPVIEDDEVTGVVSVVLDSGTPAVTDDMAQIIELERAMRGRAESAGQRAEFLAEATTALDSSLDLGTTLRTLAGIVVPDLADLCLVDMLTGRSREVKRLAVAHRDRTQEAHIWDLTRRFPSAPELRRGIQRVLADGSTEFIPEVTDEVLEGAFPNPEHRERIRALGLSSSIIVPIRARGRTLGAITFARLDRERAFSTAEVSLAEELTRRAALAVDNARLHTDLRRADRAQRLISEASRILSESLHWTSTIDHLARLLTASLADLCVVEAPDASGTVRTVALSHADPAMQRRVAEYLRRWPHAHGETFTAPSLLEGRSTLVAHYDDEARRAMAVDDEHLAAMRSVGICSVMTTPMIARGRPVGVFSLAMTSPDRHFDEDDLRLAEEIGRRAGVAADNARLYAERTRVARTLQRSLMPVELPRIPRLETAVRFRAAGDGSEVGGDFYDVFAVGEDEWCGVVGDVCGKGAEAAGLTALSRHTIRASARYEDGPVGVLSALNDAISSQTPSLIFATAALAWIRPGPDSALVRVARGGHLPPLVLRADGSVEALMVRGALLGVFPSVELGEDVVELATGDAIVLYTDGVTEAGAPEAALGETALHEGLAACAGLPAESIARRLEDLARAASAGLPRDDLAVLVLRYTG